MVARRVLLSMNLYIMKEECLSTYEDALSVIGLPLSTSVLIEAHSVRFIIAHKVYDVTSSRCRYLREGIHALQDGIEGTQLVATYQGRRTNNHAVEAVQFHAVILDVVLALGLTYLTALALLMVNGDGLTVLIVEVLGILYGEDKGALAVADVVQTVLMHEIELTEVALEGSDLDLRSLIGVVTHGVLLVLGEVDVQQTLDELGAAVSSQLVGGVVLAAEHCLDTNQVLEVNLAIAQLIAQTNLAHDTVLGVAGLSTSALVVLVELAWGTDKHGSGALSAEHLQGPVLDVLNIPVGLLLDALEQLCVGDSACLLLQVADVLNGESIVGLNLYLTLTETYGHWEEGGTSGNLRNKNGVVGRALPITVQSSDSDTC